MIKLIPYFLIFAIMMPLKEIKVSFIDSSTISYKGYHPAHNWSGVSEKLKGGIICKDSTFLDCIIKVIAPLDSFDSGSSGRDSNMLFYTESNKYPFVKFTSNSFNIKDMVDAENELLGVLEFHGIRDTISTRINILNQKTILSGTAKFSISLDHYNVETVLDGCGFIMKGYPSYIATTDAMTHTLSALTPSAKKAWEDTSGLVKRVADWAEPIDLNEWAGSDEVILDNWEVIGIYIGPDREGAHGEAMMKDALELEDQLGLAVYTVKDSGHGLGPAKLVEV